jgi:hypothetical protein
MEIKSMKKPVQTLKKKRDSPTVRSLREILQKGTGSSGSSVRGPVATSKPAAEISAKGRDKPEVRNLPKVKPRTSLLGVIDIDTTAGGQYFWLIFSRRRIRTPSLQSRWNPCGEKGIV